MNRREIEKRHRVVIQKPAGIWCAYRRPVSHATLIATGVTLPLLDQALREETASQYCSVERKGAEERQVARIVEEATGYYVSNDALPYCDCRGTAHSSRREAIAAARESGYTHYLVNGQTRKL